MCNSIQIPLKLIRMVHQLGMIGYKDYKDYKVQFSKCSFAILVKYHEATSKVFQIDMSDKNLLYTTILKY